MIPGNEIVAYANRVHAARLCVLAAALVMTASGFIPALLIDVEPFPQRARQLAIGSLHGVAMFGCLIWSRRRPAVALPIAALIFSGVVIANMWKLDAGAARTVTLVLLGVVLVVLLRGAHAGYVVERAARNHDAAYPSGTET